MADMPDLFPGFETHVVDVPGAQVFARSGGNGPPLLLLHGYPQTHVCWHKIAPELARHFTLVMPDLRGYGASRGPKASDVDGEAADAPPHAAYSKRAMAADAVALMRALGHDRFALVGRFHWSFLARPAPFPETMIGRDPTYFLEYLLAQWTATSDLSAFDPAALAHYRAAFAKPEVIHATCEDYRAGATIDVTLDAADRTAKRQIACPMLALWGVDRGHGAIDTPLKAWEAWCPNVQGVGVESGHFLPEEQPAKTLSHLIPFLLASSEPD